MHLRSIITMVKLLCSLSGAVRRLSATVSCRIRSALPTPIHTCGMPQAIHHPAQISAGLSPPPLLPAPWTASFSTPPGALHLGRLRHLTAWLPQSSTSRTYSSTAAQEAAQQAKYSKQLTALVRPRLEHSPLYWAPAST